MLDNDPDLLYHRELHERYDKQQTVVVTYAPETDLLAEHTLNTLTQLRDDLLALERVTSVTSILDVPLLFSPPIPIDDLSSTVRTLTSPKTDREMARKELRTSPLYQNLLVSPDLETTALLVTFAEDKEVERLVQQRNTLREQKAQTTLTTEDQAELDRIESRLDRYRDRRRAQRHEDIKAIREVMDPYRDQAELFLGGVSMIADDMITFIKKDLTYFGTGVLCFLILVLGIIFQRLRWIGLPMLCCGVSVLYMIGLLGWFQWEVTVISSNFISLQLIITMAISIHLIVYFRESLVRRPTADHRRLVLETVCTKLKPCVYAALTTIAGFGSLVLCDILPVITFGWMMIAGLAVSLTLTFLLFPATLMLLPKPGSVPFKSRRLAVTAILARFTQHHGRFIILAAGAAMVLSLIGMSRLQVENSFIDYFKESTEIHQGMTVIDRELGGTTPLDVIITFPASNPSPNQPADIETGDDDDFALLDELDDTPAAKETYWFTAAKMAEVKQVHDYLDALPETGKVLSLATTLQITEQLNQGKAPDSFELALLYNETPDQLKDILIRPYVSVEHDEVRFSVRVRDSEESLRRNELLQQIRHDLTETLGIPAKRVRLGGMLVLYNNMLQSLFRSQVLTLGLTIIALMIMFLILFRSLQVSVIAIFPNVLSVGVVLGVMGWMGIPLDMMTITIAAISVGIAVDDTIHYIHRFKKEFQADRHYVHAMHRSHESIGYAMYYTSITVIAGFSILVLSNFIPSIYFGLLTGLAMLIALTAALTLLPQLIILIKPFGRES